MFDLRSRLPSQRPRRSAVEQLEDRQLLTSLALVDHWIVERPQIDFGSFSARDDAQVVVQDSERVRIDVLSNDHALPYWGYYTVNPIAGATVSEVLRPAHGSVQFSEDRQAVLYTPDPGFEGIDQFLYTARDADGVQSVAKVFVNVVAPFVAIDDWFPIDTESEGNALDLLRNDQANAARLQVGDLRIVSIAAQSGDGSIEISDDGRQVIYSPDAEFEGLESFVYTVEDENGHTSSATVKLRVVPGDRPTDTSSEAWREEVEQFFLEQSLLNASSHFGNPVDGDWRNSCGYGFFCLPRLIDTNNMIFFSTGTVGQGAPVAVTTSLALDSSADAQDLTYSTTNVQVDGVDEGDLVKTDGEFLYVISNVGGETPRHEAVLIDVGDQENPEVVSRVAFAGQILSQYLVGDRLIVVSRSQDGAFDPQSSSDAQGVLVTVLDISDRNLPTIVSETAVEGNLVDSRSVGNFLYLVSATQTSLKLPELPRPIDLCATGDRGCFYETKSQFLERVRGEIGVLAAEFEIEGTHYASYDDQGELIASGTTDHALSLVDLKASYSWDYRQSLSTAFAIDVTTGSPQVESGTSIVTSTSNGMYASADSLYLFAEDGIANSQIHKFDFADDGGGIEWVASGSVEGSILNQFSIDEHQGYLRVAAHLRSTSSGTNSLYVLEQQGEQLEVVSSIDNLAPGERIYSVRFMGDRGFVVTFRKVDPLFVLDLSDPLDPQVTGQLKVPGYSNYLQLVDENTLLGIGRNADENSGLFQGLQASLFDLTDLAEPTLIDRYTFEGGRNTWSPMANDAWSLSDHHAVSYFASHQALAIPIYSLGGWGSRFAGVDDTPIFSDAHQSAIRVLHVDSEIGFVELGQVEFDTHATRSVRIGDALYSIAPDRIKVNELLRPENQLGEVVVQEDYKPFYESGQSSGTIWLGGGIFNGSISIRSSIVTTTIFPAQPPAPDPPEVAEAADDSPTTRTFSALPIDEAMYDLDGDDVIGFGDLAILTSQFLKDAPEGGSGLTADFDGSGRVDFGDMSLFSASFGKRLQAPVSNAAAATQAAQDAVFLQIGLEDLQQDDRDAM